MKITLDLPSVITGGAVALALGLVAGFTPQVTQVPGATNTAPRQITGQFSPHPSDLVCLESRAGVSIGFDSPIVTVPAGQILVLTGLTWGDMESTAYVRIDGTTRAFESGSRINFRNDSLAFAGGVPLVAGQTVQLVRGSFSEGYVWLHGYWADA